PGATLKSGSKKKAESLVSDIGEVQSDPGSTQESSSKVDKIERIAANLPSSSSGEAGDTVTTLGKFLEINQATPNDLGFATMINPELPLTQEEVNKYTNIVRNNKLAGMPQVSSDYDIKPVLEKTQRQIELDEMDNNDKARQYLSTRVFDESVMGKLIKPVIGKIVGITKEERIHLDELARMAADIDESGEAESYAYDANMVQRVAGGLLAIMADTPIFGGIGAAVKIPTLAFGRLVGSGVSKLGASRAVVQAMTNIFSSSPQMAAVLGGHAVLRELTEQVINQGKVFGEDPENGGVDMKAVAEVGGKQAIVGAMIGPVGSGTSILSNSPKITGLINNSIVRQAAKAGINAAGLVAESAVFAYGDALVDRERKLSDVSGEELLESLMTIGGLRAMHLPSRIKAPRKSQRTKTEIDAINKHIDTEPESKSGIEQLKADKAKLDAVMNDPNIPWEAKAEIASGINGVNPALWEPVLNCVDLIETPDGVHQLTSYDANGNKISIRDFQSKSEAFREYNNMDQIMQENNTMINIRNADVKEITKVDKALIDIGYPDGIRDQALNDAIITPKPNRTAKQNAMVEDLMEAAGKIKTEPAKEKKPKERMERPDAELKVEETKDGKFIVKQEGTEVAPEFKTKPEAEKFIENFKELTQGERTFEQEKAVIDEKVAAGEAKKPEPTITKKPKEDAVQKREAKKVDVEEPAAPGKEVGEGKGIKKEKVTYVTEETSEKYADMSKAPDGDYVFFHNSGEKRDVIDPSKSGTNKMMPTSKAEVAAAATVGGVSYYYTDTKGHDVGGVEHRVKVPKEKVYDADADPLNLGLEAKKQYQEKHPGKGWDNNHRVFWITKLAAEKGYDITVATWGDKTRAHSVKKMTPTEGVEFTEARKEGYTRQEPVYAEKVYTDVLDKINKQRNKEGVYDELYHAKANYQNPKSDLYKNKEALTDLVKKSNLPEALKAEYLTSLTAQDVPGKAIPPKVAEPPAKVPPKPPVEPPELPGPGEGKKPDGVKAVGRRRKARKEAAKKEDSYS
ncbi:hypothetical protein KA005_81385, partial [bacterium]|nr:hypothetical protein [bacterium]